MPKRTYYLFIIALTSFLFCSCFTSKTIKQAKADRRNEKITAMQNAYLNEENNIVINFTIDTKRKSDDPNKHVEINIDSLLKFFDSRKGLEYLPDSSVEENFHLNRIYRMPDKHPRILGIEIKRSAIKPGFDTSVIQKDISSSISICKSKEYGGKFTGSIRRLNAQHIAFNYLAEDSVTRKKYGNIVLSIEPSPKRKYTRYLLVPVSVTADAATSPLQLLGLGMLYFIAAAMKY